MDDSDSAQSTKRKDHLKGARVYLSGPMDFVASRTEERKNGWRVRVGEFLRSLGATVFDPWQKPEPRGLHGYGREDDFTTKIRDKWTYETSEEGAKARADCTQTFWETMHIDLRMVDISDFVVAYCPTNIYSVGTPHEIITARQQHKPVLFVSPPVRFPALEKLYEHLQANNDEKGEALLKELADQIPVKSNPEGIPSLWYMPLVGCENFFDGFGYAVFRDEFGWSEGPTDKHEKQYPPEKPLLPFLKKLNTELPQKWNHDLQRYEEDDDWLLFEIEQEK